MLAALLLAADLAGTLTVSDRTEVRVRVPGTTPELASVDAETALDVEVALAARRWAVSLAYTPRFTLWDVADPAFTPTALQGGRAKIEWIGHRARLSVEEDAGYGATSFAGVSLAPSPVAPDEEGPPPPHVQPVPTAPIIQFVSSTTALRSQLTLRRWTVDTSVGYQLAGGADAPSRLLLPLQQGPFGEVTADFAAWRRDHVFTKLSAAELTFSSGPESVLGEADEGWRHLWSRTVSTRIAGGVAEAWEVPAPTAAAELSTYPVVEASFERHGEHLDVDVGGRLGPGVNRLIGLVQQEVQGTVTASHRYHRLTTRVFASALQSLPTNDVNATSFVAGEIGVSYDATKVVALDAGTRGMWQRISPTGVPFLQSTVFAGVTVHAPRVQW
jgi:hypothetical protein